jgi:hypothetical protein
MLAIRRYSSELIMNRFIITEILIYRKSLLFITIIVGILFSTTACDRRSKHKGFDRPPEKHITVCQDYDFNITLLNYKELPYSGYSLKGINDTTFPSDSNGIALFEWNGKYYYHPGVLCKKASELAAAFYDSSDSLHLNVLLKYVHHLMSQSVEVDGAAYFPIPFDYNVNQQEDGLLLAPWFSGMTQGVGLSAMIRTFLITGDSTYLDFSHKVFRTFQRLRGESEPWIAFTDSAGCYWIEEYPVWPPSMTLNGFIWAIYGVYEYFFFTGSKEAQEILVASLRSVRNYIPVFRRPGNPSFYGLRFGHYAPGYHMLHIDQLRFLEKMTDDSFFGGWADTLLADYNAKKR